MASDPRETSQTQQKFQIYSTPNAGVTPFWRDKYEKDAKKYWDIFYKRHQDRFFKDRHYLDKEWGQYLTVPGKRVILEVGCGAGNTIFPLVSTYPDIFVHACDFSPRAVDLVKAHKDFNDSRLNAFVCDLTIDDLSKEVSPSSVDIVTMIFVLSAVSPEKMPLVLQNIKKVLKPDGYVLLRDYAVGDLAQERFTCKDQKISENFYVRGDGTRAFYFSNEFLTSLFKSNGFNVEELGLCCKQVENRSRELVMNRRWIQAVFRFSDISNSSSCEKTAIKEKLIGEEHRESKFERSTSKETLNGVEVDMSEGLAAEMFGISPSHDREVIEVKVTGCNFKIRVVSKEYQHTCKSTGLMLWESARMMASLLAANPSIVRRKKVLELGCGCAGICSMVATGSAELVVASDTDTQALELLTQNVASNLVPPSITKLVIQTLEWGNDEHIQAISELNPQGFDVIIGTDVTYVAEAILPLFSTAKKLISSNYNEENQRPSLILCHILRRVDESSIISSASQFGFKLMDKWQSGISSTSSQSILASWFPQTGWEEFVPSSALMIMYFQMQ
ncbi:tRNA N(3)-methylcytidine methyltransferase METTL6 [Euphorbia peplus]|nr:tRNA N(3)-methylcytidine methyltransferase METTL6 [Euphorbia peplus]